MQQYWNERFEQSYKYKGEYFYTITPIPCYYRRRTILLNAMKPILSNESVKTVCDYGCGDGYYLNYFSGLFPEKKYCGMDISDELLKKCKATNPKAEFINCMEAISSVTKFDLVYSLSVFAHVLDDSIVLSIFSSISKIMNKDGLFILFEQTAPERYGGNEWVRRENQQYTRLAEEAGFSTLDYSVITFPAHRQFERKFAPVYKRLFVKGSTLTEKAINANRSKVFRILSSFFLFLSFNPVRNRVSDFGNTFFVFKKEGYE